MFTNPFAQRIKSSTNGRAGVLVFNTLSAFQEEAQVHPWTTMVIILYHYRVCLVGSLRRLSVCLIHRVTDYPVSAIAG